MEKTKFAENRQIIHLPKKETFNESFTFPSWF